MPVSIIVADAGTSAAPPTVPVRHAVDENIPDDLKAEAMANSTVQALLEIFPVEKTTIEEEIGRWEFRT